ncbi:MAG: hypothetical protein ABIT76_00090 [Chthoniobacterales bacterium]
MKKTLVSGSKPIFQKTEVPCLYRYSSNGVYYALFKHEGKQKRLSLQTTDKPMAKRLLGDRQREMGRVDASQGKLTLASLAERYLTTIQGQGGKHCRAENTSSGAC